MLPALLADVLRAALAQRLVRRVCERCRARARLSGDEGWIAAGLSVSEEWRGSGCHACHGGYRGRVAIAELLVVTPDLAALIARGATADQIRDAARMGSLAADGADAVRGGLTTVEEVRSAVTLAASSPASDPEVVGA